MLHAPEPRPAPNSDTPRTQAPAAMSQAPPATVVAPVAGAHHAPTPDRLGQLLQTALARRAHRHADLDHEPAGVLARQRGGTPPEVADDAAARGIQALFEEFPPPPPPRKKELQQSNFCVGLTTGGDLYVSRVGGMATETPYLRTIRSHIESSEYHVGRDIRLAGKFNTAYTSGNHAEMCIVAAAYADGLTLSTIYCSGPHCAFCAALMATAGIARGAPTGDDRQTGWAHPFAPIFLGSSVDEDTASQLRALKQFELEPSATDVVAGGIAWRPTKPKPKKGRPWL